MEAVALDNLDCQQWILIHPSVFVYSLQLSSWVSGTWTLLSLSYPTPSVTDHERAVPVSARQQERWWVCRACVCTGTWTLLSHPTPPHPTWNWSWKSSACVCRTARKMMRLPCLCVYGNMNDIIPPHHTPPVTDDERAVPVSAGQQERWWGCRACVCAREHGRYYPPPHPTGNWWWKSSACVCRTARKMMSLLCLCVYRNMNVIIPPHPTQPHPTPPVTDDERAVPVSAGQQERWWGCRACVCAQEHGRYYPAPLHPTPPHTHPSGSYLASAAKQNQSLVAVRMFKNLTAASDWFWRVLLPQVIESNATSDFYLTAASDWILLPQVIGERCILY